MPYANSYILGGKFGNNTFSYAHRENKYLTIPSIIEWTLEDIAIGDVIVFEEREDGKLKSCKWLKNFIRLQISHYRDLPEIIIFDNHNHALYFWLEALRKWVLEKGFELIHIDEHSDLWKNEHSLDPKKAIQEESYAWEFTNFSCNVGNYIEPAINAGIIGKMIRIENEFELDKHMAYTPPKNSVLNLDMDFFAPEMNFIDESKKLECIRNLIHQVRYITIATSPFFIDQKLAIQKLKDIFSKL